MGSPAIATPYLDALLGSAFEVTGVVTQPDRPSGRGRRSQPTAVKEAALERGLEVLEPSCLEEPEFGEAVRGLAPDLILSVACGHLLPPWLLALPRLAATNVHYSLLPELRGAAPVQWALIRGLARTGVSIQHMAVELDAGDIIAQTTVDILPDDSQQALFERLTEAGVPLLREVLARAEEGELPREPQDHSRATWAPALEKADGRIDWRRPAVELHNLVRGCDPWPGAHTTLQGRPLRIWRTDVAADSWGAGGQPGRIVEAPGRDALVVATGCGGLRVHEIQAEGRRRMSAADFVRGARLAPGTVLGVSIDTTGPVSAG